MCSTPGTTLRPTSTDGRHRSQGAKIRTRKRRKKWWSPVAVASVALLSVTLLTVYLWGKPRDPVPVQQSLVQGAPEIGFVTEILSSAEEGGSARARPMVELPHPSTISPLVVPPTPSNAHFEPPSIEGCHTGLASPDGLSLVFKKLAEPTCAAAHDPHATENTAVVIPGNAAFSIGGTGVNGAVGAALLERASRHNIKYTPIEFRERSSRLHQEAYKQAQARTRGRLIRISTKKGVLGCPTRQIFTFVPKANPSWSLDAVGLRAGVVFLDELKLEYALSGNPFNRFLLYVVPPNGRAKDADFYRAYRQTLLDALYLVKAYNSQSSEGVVTRVRLPPFWMGRAAQGRKPHHIAMHCLKTLRIAAERGLTAGLTIELLDDEDCSFKRASRKLEERALRSLWIQGVQPGSERRTPTSISQAD